MSRGVRPTSLPVIDIWTHLLSLDAAQWRLLYELDLHLSRGEERDDGAGFVKGPFSETGFNGGPDFLLTDGDGLVADWTWVDLQSLGLVSGLSFSMASSGLGAFGLNKPAYFALDDLTLSPTPVPVPAAALWLMGSALGALGALSSRRTAG
jgi:hypothetical protein